MKIINSGAIQIVENKVIKELFSKIPRTIKKDTLAIRKIKITIPSIRQITLQGEEAEAIERLAGGGVKGIC
tara:strand:- start:1030 stop:1242 length:213 start_codon:yes stop_codon:yes gene_type:complete